MAPWLVRNSASYENHENTKSKLRSRLPLRTRLSFGRTERRSCTHRAAIWLDREAHPGELRKRAALPHCAGKSGVSKNCTAVRRYYMQFNHYCKRVNLRAGMWQICGPARSATKNLKHA